MYDSKVHNVGYLKNNRRKLRKRGTNAEDLLWKFLRGKSLGIQFRRQFGICNFIVDFCCWKKKIVIEVDGGIHDDPKVSAFDKSRTEFLESLGFRVLRFKNKEVFDDLALVIDKIKKFIN